MDDRKNDAVLSRHSLLLAKSTDLTYFYRSVLSRSVSLTTKGTVSFELSKIVFDLNSVAMSSEMIIHHDITEDNIKRIQQCVRHSTFDI